VQWNLPQYLLRVKSVNFLPISQEKPHRERAAFDADSKPTLELMIDLGTD
jgi:hypothetical protein